MKKESVLEQRRKRMVYCFVLSEIINGLNKLKEEYKVDYNINAKETWFVLELSNGDKMTYISLDIFTIKEKIKNDNFTNDEKYKKFKKVNNTSYWRANINEVYFTIKNNIIKAENENSIDIYKNNENYKTGNYFKTYGIAKEVLNSDVWKNRFWDYKKNKEKNDELLEDEIYYTVDDDGVDFNSCFDFFNLKIGNYFKTKAEALNFFENDYPKSIKRIKDFTNE